MSSPAVLTAFPHFSTLPPDEIERLVPCCSMRSFQRGETLWRQGAEPTSFTFVAYGHLKVVKQRPDGNETILGLFHRGDCIGAVAAYRGMPYPAAAIALTDVKILGIPRDRLMSVLKADGSLMALMVGDMTKRTGELVTRIDELTTSGAEQRLAALFVGLAARMGSGSGQETRIDLALSRQELADLINVRVETAIRIMSRWNKDGPVRTTTDGFVIEDHDQLEQLAESGSIG